ncbi:MAG TPA: CheR family methyltransferase [Actinomycetota bacterium]|nr:CheR family methyltransferase [Actinomycetota bacterium]
MSTATDQDLEGLLEYLRDSRGFDFTGYKRSTLTRRIQKRMEQVHVDSFATYLDHLQVDPDEFTALFNCILINVTSFFRDEPIWTFLRDDIIPRLLEQKRDDDTVRVWVAGCASGQEAYSLSMLLAEAMGRPAFLARVKIYATDVDEEALDEARQGIYTGDDMKAVPEDLAERYFTSNSTGKFVFDREIRRTVVFGRHDLVQDAPISKIDLLSCRNTLMYFNADIQTKILSNFRFALNPGGFLILGKAEMLFTRVRAFAPVDLKRRVFVPTSDGTGEGFPPAPRAMDPADPDETAQRAAAFEVSPVAQVLVTLDGRLAEANEEARTMLRLSRGDIGRSIGDLELAYRPVELRSRLDEAERSRAPVSVTGVEWVSPGSEPAKLDVRVMPVFARGGALLGMSVVFQDVTRFIELEEELQASHHELETALEELQSTNEELETTNEELQSTNEELETTNEELQSTNEELETMNEELQSTNEELETVNDEARQRTDELSGSNEFLGSVLASIRGGLVVVDRELRIEVWNAQCEDMWGMRAEEVLGQQLPALDIGLPVQELTRPLRDALDGEHSTVEVAATTRKGRSITCQVSFSPLSGPEGMITGALALMEQLEKD